jgi:formylglycine-generating enzyme required for sulfatase activity
MKILQFIIAVIMVSSLLNCGSDDSQPTLPQNPEVVAFEPNMITIPAGSFAMGSDQPPDNMGLNEVPSHTVEISKAFFICETEITEVQYSSVMQNYSYDPERDINGRPKAVTWFQAVEFCNKLSKRDGLDTVYVIVDDYVTWIDAAKGYRLPTEAEWEYACRANTTADYAGGDMSLRIGECHEEPVLEALGWYCFNAGNGRTQPVKTRAPNSWGLYDMHGNLPEWCWDWYASYSAEQSIDPKGPPSGTTRVNRGGNVNTKPFWCRSAARSSLEPNVSSNIACGIRLVREKIP